MLKTKLNVLAFDGRKDMVSWCEVARHFWDTTFSVNRLAFFDETVHLKNYFKNYHWEAIYAKN